MLGNLLECHITYRMPVAVVDQLEVVEVHKDQADRVGHAPRALYFQPEQVVEVTVVTQPRQRIGRGQPLRLLVQVRVLQRDGGRGRQQLQDPDVVDPERRSQRELERAKRPATRQQRHDQLQGPGAERASN